MNAETVILVFFFALLGAFLPGFLRLIWWALHDD